MASWSLKETWEAAKANCSSCDGDEACQCWTCEVAKAGQREIDRLRAALEHIRTPIHQQCCANAWERDGFMDNHDVEIADAALAEKDPNAK